MHLIPGIEAVAGMYRGKKQAHPMPVERSTISSSGGQRRGVRWPSTLSTRGRESGMEAILLRTTPLSQSAEPLAVVV